MKNPCTKRIVAGVTALVAAGFTLAAQAALPSINGSIVFYGGAVLNGSISAGTEFMSYTGPAGVVNPLVLDDSQTGDYASVPGDTPVVFNPFSFNPAPASPFTLWQFSVGGNSYSLTANSFQVLLQNSRFIKIQGQGTLSITGFADTPATWTIVDTGSTPVLSFGSAAIAVPEPSSVALMLLLLSVSWLLVARRRSPSCAKCAVTVRVRK